MRTNIKLFCVVWFFLLVGNIGTLFLLKDYRYFSKVIPVKEFDVLEYYYPEQTPKEFKQFLAASPQKIMQKIMNFTSGEKGGRQKSDRIQDIFDHAQSGGGLTCAGMSELFLHALRLQGYKARKLFVVKSIGDPYVTHTLVEVFENNKWVIYDPTFNVSFKKNDQLLSAVDICKSLLDGSFKDIEPIFYGEVAYPARLETYPIYWLAHFNNVLMFKYGDYSSSWFIRNTLQLITRYWQGPVLYYFAPNGKPNDYLELINWFYFIFTCVLPLFTIFLGTIILRFIVKESFQNKL